MLLESWPAGAYPGCFLGDLWPFLVTIMTICFKLVLGFQKQMGVVMIPLDTPLLTSILEHKFPFHSKSEILTSMKNCLEVRVINGVVRKLRYAFFDWWICVSPNIRNLFLWRIFDKVGRGGFMFCVT